MENRGPGNKEQEEKEFEQEHSEKSEYKKNETEKKCLIKIIKLMRYR